MKGSISRRTIIKSALLIISCIAVLTFTSLFYMQQLNKEIEQINGQYNYKVKLLFEMSQIVRDRTFDVFSMYVSDDTWFKDEVFMRFNKRALEFIQLREKLLETKLSPGLRIELDKALTIIKTTQPLQEQIVEYLLNDNQDEIKNTIVVKDLPLEFELYKVFDRLIILASSETARAQRLLEKEYQTAVLITLAFSVLIIIITVSIMIYSMNKIHANEMSISWDAVHDHLTRVYNRRWLTGYLSSRAMAIEENERHAVLYIDLDNFKPINDQYGHSVGDKVLVDMVEIFRNCVRKNDFIVRVGGDEFVILLENCTKSKSIEIATAVLDGVAGYKLIDKDKEIKELSCSIGIGFIDQETGWQQALEFADEECNRVKHKGKNNLSVS